MAALKKAYLGMQCFWGESSFAKIDGVLKTRVGYAGGTKAAPTYESIGDHTEVIEVQFDDTVVSFEKILDWFWSHHDPTQEYKRQYQSAVLYEDSEQKSVAEKCAKKAQEKFAPKKVLTRIERLQTFYQAEDYHQKFWLQCQPHILRELGVRSDNLAASTLAAKVNAFLAGYNDFGVLDKLAKEYGMKENIKNYIADIAKRGGDPRACH